MPNHVTDATCTASRTNGASPASSLPTHPRSAASTRPAPPRSTSHASSLVTPAGRPAGGTTTLSPPRVYKLEDGQIVRSLPAPSPGALAAGIRERLGRAVTARRPATALRQTTSAEDIRDTVRAVLCVGTAPPRGPTVGCASGSSVSEPALDTLGDRAKNGRKMCVANSRLTASGSSCQDPRGTSGTISWRRRRRQHHSTLCWPPR